MSDQAKFCPTCLLSDSPTTEDKFAHQSVAAAIAETIASEQGGKCIVEVIAIMLRSAESQSKVNSAWLPTTEPNDGIP